MSDPEAALAMVAATTIVAAMATSAWEVTKAGVARVFRRTDGAESGPESGGIEVRLERSAARIADAADPDNVRQAQIVRWREDLEDLMHDHPDAEADLRTLVEAIRQQLPPVQQQWVQRIEARDGGVAFGAIGPGSSVIVHYDRDTPPTADGR
ncbi:hypothetical protein OG978_42295 (plasmid) [Streptomyces sp. NBC_01591]|uniref:hypothetical protein n=1 Tax=Streptomyces sp. NBC_01591 TaxID=2975888 RepID=UPI002DD95A31|nr:hypothetical protein [Streptomyces sp. NBC_01591]WSD73826.1 hypothetical protein OG978_42295 [Streptomyces sp. NBC_01591]